MSFNVNNVSQCFYLCVSQVKGVELGQRWKLPVVNEAKNILNVNKYSQTFTNSHLSTTTTPQQQPFFWVDSAYIHCECFNLSTMATFFCPQGGRCREVQLSKKKKKKKPKTDLFASLFQGISLTILGFSAVLRFIGLSGAKYIGLEFD